MNALDRALGDACKILFPIPERIYFGNPESHVAVCTLSSIRLLKEASRSNLMHHVAVVGRLLSENRGIDELVRFLNSHETIKMMLVCGRDTRGHAAGDALILLHANGIDREGRIIGSQSPDPVLAITREEAERFRKRIRVVDRRGETDLGTITALVRSLNDQ